MECSLSLENIACIESGLHGLGHLVLYCDEDSKILRKFINSVKLMNDRLIVYANKLRKVVFNKAIKNVYRDPEPR